MKKSSPSAVPWAKATVCPVDQVRRGIDVGDVPALAATVEVSPEVVVAVAERPARVQPAIVAVDLRCKEVGARVVGS